MVRTLHSMKYLAVFTIPLTVWFSLNSSGIAAFSTLLYVFGVVPLLELLFKPDHTNVSEVEAQILQKDRLYDWLLYLIVPVQWGFLIYFVSLAQTPADPFSTIGHITAFGIMCGAFGINVAHELGHRKNKWEQLLSKTLLLSSLYMHFFIEHNRGHHKRVSTVEDPASARYGEHIYAFWLRSLWGSFHSAWHLEFKRLAKKGLPGVHWSNEMIWYQVLQLTILAILWWWFGIYAMLLFWSSAVVGILLLETVNYIEHYGLTRQQQQSGNYERVMPQHSWNSDHLIGRLLLFELSRHSDHHYKASKKYQVLKHHQDSPQMPTGYPGMMLLALFPPAWFNTMHNLIAKH